MTKGTMTAANYRPAPAAQAGPATGATPTNPIRTRPTEQLVTEAVGMPQIREELAAALRHIEGLRPQYP